MKAFISLRMNGRDDKTIKEDMLEALEVLQKDLIEHNELNQGDSLELIDTMNHTYLPPKPERLHYLGASIQKLADADIVFFYNDWYKAKGCWVEFVTSSLYNKKVIIDYPNNFIGWTADVVRKAILDAIHWNTTTEEVKNND